MSDSHIDAMHSESQYPLLSRIKNPADLKRLEISKLPELCSEIRSYLINCLSVNPGHFGSSMGAVDLIVALHYVFDTPRDRIVFDVGHQAYAHKLLTGRFEEFERNRMKGGLSGFPFPKESAYDSFVCGHAGNSISAALGMAIADSMTKGEEDRKTVALIGDASISGGLAFEGLNNASQNPNNLLIVLNDNEMSIDDNVGALHRYLSDISTSAKYNKFRYRLYTALRKRGLLADKGKGLVLRFNNALKSLVAGQQNIFEGLNIRYFGPFDGNDVLKMVKVLQDIKDMKGPRILHVHTRKGKGYSRAEKNPADWHAPGKFNKTTGIRKAEEPSLQAQPRLWQEIFGETIVEMAKNDERIVGVTAAMPSGTSLGMLSEVPGRLFDVGISEGHAVTFAGGLASAGKRPYVAIYSSFLQRAYDNIIHDVAIQGLPVTFCIDRAGLVGEDGVTHHGLFDLAYLRVIPGMKIASPMDPDTLKALLRSSIAWDGPLAIRYPRGKAYSCPNVKATDEIEVGKGRIITSQDAAVAVLTLGPIGNDAASAIAELENEGIKADHYDMIWVKPLDSELLKKIAGNHKAVITIEDGSLEGGFGSAVRELLGNNGYQIELLSLGIPDKWIYQGTVEELHRDCGIDKESIKGKVRELSMKYSGQNTREEVKGS